jgi:hypothetical protein
MGKSARECGSLAVSLHRPKPSNTPWEWASQIATCESMGLRMAPLPATEMASRRLLCR